MCGCKPPEFILNGNTMTFLTICIPTYKRLSLLKMLLEGLLPQAQALGVKIQLNDNCSQDGTAEYLATLSCKYSCLYFRINPKTVPIDENMFLAMKFTESPYVYPLGDDDFLPEGTLAAIVNELADHRPDILALSGLLTDYKLNPQKGLFPKELQGHVFNDPRPAFHSLWDKMPFGSFVMHRDFINELTFRKYYGTCHAYTGVVWERLYEQFTSGKSIAVRCMESPSVMLRGGKKSWNDYKVRIYLHDIPKWFSLLPTLYEEDLVVIKEEHIKKHGSLSSLLAFRRSGQLTNTNCQEYMPYFSEDVQRKATIVSNIPPFLACILRVFVKMYIWLK